MQSIDGRKASAPSSENEEGCISRPVGERAREREKTNRSPNPAFVPPIRMHPEVVQQKALLIARPPPPPRQLQREVGGKYLPRSHALSPCDRSDKSLPLLAQSLEGAWMDNPIHAAWAEFYSSCLLCADEVAWVHMPLLAKAQRRKLAGVCLLLSLRILFSRAFRVFSRRTGYVYRESMHSGRVSIFPAVPVKAEARRCRASRACVT